MKIGDITASTDLLTVDAKPVANGFAEATDIATAVESLEDMEGLAFIVKTTTQGRILALLTGAAKGIGVWTVSVATIDGREIPAGTTCQHRSLLLPPGQYKVRARWRCTSKKGAVAATVAQLSAVFVAA